VLALVLIIFVLLGYQFYKVQAANSKAEADKAKRREQVSVSFLSLFFVSVPFV
jgi:hypothetical protein